MLLADCLFEAIHASATNVLREKAPQAHVADVLKKSRLLVTKGHLFTQNNYKKSKAAPGKGAALSVYLDKYRCYESFCVSR